MTDESPLDADTQPVLDNVSRRRALKLVGAAGFAGLSSVPAAADPGGNGNGTPSEADIDVLPNPNFITNARSETPPFDDDTVLFDPGPVSIPLNEIIDADEEYDSKLFRSLNDGKHQIVRPPAGYDREKEGYKAPWKPITWGEYSAVGGRATVGGVKPAAGNGNGANDDTGTRVNISVEDGIPNGRYTIWVVKFAALSEDSDLGPDDPFVTPRGNGLVGFHNLGQKFGDDGDSENDFTVDETGDGDIHVFTEGGELSGVPGFTPIEGDGIDDPVSDGPVPFVGEATDYDQDENRLIRIDNDLRAEDEIHLVGAYHYDDQTWGVYPGPWHVNHFSAVFAFDD
ncbi:hypothetical protein [Haloplanus sp.]|uniref:hypothetical protein n=1 Tax=Haloplanus sp. TaxID=1961696 RepID=UPI0026192F90|nr:hypothetical protein [Haloplanus sp.]